MERPDRGLPDPGCRNAPRFPLRGGRRYRAGDGEGPLGRKALLCGGPGAREHRPLFRPRARPVALRITGTTSAPHYELTDTEALEAENPGFFRRLFRSLRDILPTGD